MVYATSSVNINIYQLHCCGFPVESACEVLANSVCFTESIINVLPRKYIINSLKKGRSTAFVHSSN